MQINNIKYRGCQLMYRVQGSGPVLVLLHGFAEDGDIWENQFAFFPNRTLIIPDLPGSGESEMIEDMTMEGIADAIKAVIEDVDKSAEPVAMIGHSMGGYITLAFVEKYPDLVERFGLFHSTAYADSMEKKATRQKAIEFIHQHGVEAFLQTTIPNLYGPKIKNEQPQIIEAHLKKAGNFSSASLVSYYTAMMERPDRTLVLKNASVPVLFVMGRNDNVIPVNELLEQSSLPQLAYIHVIEQAGHMGMVEALNDTNNILSEFLSGSQTIIYT